jgi:small subunit ribosomal protein S17e
MGSIETSFVKHIAKDLFEKHPTMFTADFEKNKDAVNELVDIKSRRMRNIVAGYLTTLKKREKTKV